MYWMPIHYDTIEDGQNKTSHCLFCKYDALQCSYAEHSTHRRRNLSTHVHLNNKFVYSYYIYTKYTMIAYPSTMGVIIEIS